MDSSSAIAVPPELECNSCGHRWTPRYARIPLRCPWCTSSRWAGEAKVSPRARRVHPPPAAVVAEKESEPAVKE
jgi:hypothetical protein